MYSKLFGIKKTTLIRLSFIINTLLFFVLSFLSFYFKHDKELWFYIFVIFLGLHQLLKGSLLKIDSSFLLGMAFLLLGILFVYCQGFDIKFLYPVFILISFSFSCFATGLYYDQKMQYYIAFSFFLLAISTLLFILRFYSLSIFVVILFINVLLLIIGIFILAFNKR